MSEKTRSWRRSTHVLRHLAFSPAYFAFAGMAPTVVLVAPHAAAQEAGPVSLQEALNRAIEADPGLRAASAGVDAAAAGRRQAAARLNPVLGADVENFGGQGDLRGLQGAETTFNFSQEIERGGRRRARILVADKELHGAELERVVRGLDLLREVQSAYFEALAAEELTAIERERLATAESLSRSVERRVAAARDPLLAGARATAGVAEARIALSRAEAEAATARARLASFWKGDETLTLVRADFALPQARDHEHQVPTDANPDVARLAAQRDRAEAAARLERSLGYQNPSLSLGYRRFEDRDGDGALVAGFSVPLAVFDRNRGSIARAQAERSRAEFDLEAGRRSLAREFAALQRALASDAEAVRATEEEVIPQAERALSLAQTGYDRGAFSYLDVLEAQRSLSDSRARRVEALRSYHSNEAALDRLTARFAEALPGEETHQ